MNGEFVLGQLVVAALQVKLLGQRLLHRPQVVEVFQQQRPLLQVKAAAEVGFELGELLVESLEIVLQLAQLVISPDREPLNGRPIASVQCLPQPVQRRAQRQHLRGVGGTFRVGQRVPGGHRLPVRY